jgi:hypothetical protein
MSGFGDRLRQYVYRGLNVSGLPREAGRTSAGRLHQRASPLTTRKSGGEVAEGEESVGVSDASTSTVRTSSPARATLCQGDQAAARIDKSMHATELTS